MRRVVVACALAVALALVDARCKKFINGLEVKCIGRESDVTKAERYINPDNARQYFNQFMKTHNKHYANVMEQKRRYKIFVDNIKKINSLNKNSRSALYGITQFTDLTSEEFARIYEPLRPVKAKGKGQGHVHDTSSTSTDTSSSSSA